MKSYSFSHNDFAMQNDINFFETSVVKALLGQLS